MEVGYCLGLSLEAKAAYDKRILELEKENTELLEKVERLQAERNALIETIRGTCLLCKYVDVGFHENPCATCVENKKCKWQWRGVQKEDGNEAT